MGWGAIAGGAADGYQAAEALQLKKRAQANADADAAEQAKQRERAEKWRIGQGGIGKPGDYVPVNYDPRAANDEWIAKNTPAAPAERPSLLSRVGGALGLGGDREGVPAIPNTPPIALTQTPMGQAIQGPASAPQPGDVSEVVVPAPTKAQQRALTEEDIAMQRWDLAKRYGTPQDEQAAATSFFSARATGIIRDLGAAPLSTISAKVSEVLGTDIELAYGLDAKGEKTKTIVATNGQGEVLGQWNDRGAMVADLGGRIKGDPMAAFTVANTIKQNELNIYKVQADMANEAKRIAVAQQGADNQTRSVAIQGAVAESEASARQQKAEQEARKPSNRLYALLSSEDFDPFLDAVLLQQLTQAVDADESYTKISTGVDGEETVQKGGGMTPYGQRLITEGTKRLQQSPYYGKIKIGDADIGGETKRVYVVGDQMFRDWTRATSYAAQLYGKPQAAQPAPRSAIGR